MTELTLGEFKHVLGHLIDNNKELVDKGDTPIAVCIEGDAGVGKTMSVEQLAKEKGMAFRKINLAQIEEPAELVGFPYKEYKVMADGKEQWISSDLLKELSCEDLVSASNESRMSYAVPAWVPREFNPNGTMLVLDDFSRANSLILQAVMEIINTGSYVSWSLPKYTSIVLTSNPDNGAYNVTGLDAAVKSRMLTFYAKFNIDEWARWAENFGIDGRAINFAMLYSTELFEPKNNVTIANARNYTTFCRAISGIKDWSTAESLGLIMQIASGSFLEKDNVIGTLFTQFINNKLDKLISPEKMLVGNWETVKRDLEECVYENGEYRAHIASLLGTRFLNYCDKCLSSKTGPNSRQMGDRLEELFTSDTKLFSKDIIYRIVKTLCKKYVALTNNWFNKTFIKEVVL